MKLFCPLPWLLLFSVLFMACGSDPDEGLEDISLEINPVRVDSLMRAYVHDRLAHPELDAFTAYERHLQAERDFFYEWILLDPRLQAPRPAPSRLDSILALQLGRTLADSNMLMLLDTIAVRFPHEADLTQRLILPLKRLKKHFPDIQLPAFRTHANGYMPSGDARSIDQVVPTPHFFSLGLHFFLGKDWPFYPANIPAFMRRRFEPEFLPVAVAKEIALGMVAPLPREKRPTLLDAMVRAGIEQYFVQQLLPHTPDSLCLSYSSEQMAWAEHFEARIYKELIEDLYSTVPKPQQEFLSEKPFTTHLSQESAPRIGVYCGWKIVEAYLERHPEVTLAELAARQDYEVIFKEAKYKP
jgi:hypothetical protein